MRNSEGDSPIVYTLLDVAEPSTHSTPARRETAGTTGQSREDRTFLQDIGFDAPITAGRNSTQRRAVPFDNSVRQPPSVFDDPHIHFDRRRTHMKPGRFDGTGSLESFLAQFEVCAKYNHWTEGDRVDFLRCALDKAATQLLWDFGAQENVTYEELVGRLRQRYGAEGQAETFRAQLYYRRQRSDENLSDLLHDIRRLVVLAYPVPTNATTEILARDAFLEAIRDRELSLKVREREPRSIDEAYRMALRLSAYQSMSDGDDRRRPSNRVLGMHGGDTAGQLQAQLDGFLVAQRHWQRELEEKMLRRLDELRGPSHAGGPGRNFNQRPEPSSEIKCYNCGRVGHMARRCPHPRRSAGHQGTQQNSRNVEQREAEDGVVTNHTTQETPRTFSNNAIYVQATANGRSAMCLIDTGSEVSILPASYVGNLELQTSSRTLRAANGTEIRVLGEVTLSLKFWRGFEVTNKFLISDQICEVMLGMDWLRGHRCHIGFGTGALFIGRKRIPLVTGNGGVWCRRVVVAEEVDIPPRSQCDVLARTLYGNLAVTSPAWMTEAAEVMPGVHVGRVLLGDKGDVAPIRIINLGETAVRLAKGQSMGELHPVRVTEENNRTMGTSLKNESLMVEGLIQDLPDAVPVEAKETLRELLIKYEDVFSMTEGDHGNCKAS